MNLMNTPTRRRVAVASLALALVGHAGTVAADHGGEYDEHTIDEILVQGIPLDRTIRELAQPTTVLGGDELLKRQAASIGETLANELGVSSTYFGPVASRPVIRGQYGEELQDRPPIGVHRELGELPGPAGEGTDVEHPEPARVGDPAILDTPRAQTPRRVVDLAHPGRSSRRSDQGRRRYAPHEVATPQRRVGKNR